MKPWPCIDAGSWLSRRSCRRTAIRCRYRRAGHRQFPARRAMSPATSPIPGIRQALAGHRSRSARSCSSAPGLTMIDTVDLAARPESSRPDPRHLPARPVAPHPCAPSPRSSGSCPPRRRRDGCWRCSNASARKSSAAAARRAGLARRDRIRCGPTRAISGAICRSPRSNASCAMSGRGGMFIATAWRRAWRRGLRRRGTADN